MIQHTNKTLGSFFSHRAHRVHWAFLRTVRAHRRPSAYRGHRALLLKVDVRFCEIGWLNVSVKYRVFCSSVFFCEKKNATTVWYNTQTKRWGVFSLTEHTEFTEHFWRTVSSPQDSGPSPNPSPAGRGVICEVTPIGLLTQFLDSFFSHRTHRSNRALLRTVSNSQKAFGIQRSQRH